jgi:hypothetical protein
MNVSLRLRDYVEEKQMKVIHIPTEDMIGDILTKPLPAQQFNRLRDKLLGYDKMKFNENSRISEGSK